MINSKSFKPVLIGTDLNTYGVARAFHEEYGVTSKVFGSMALLMVADSKICDTTEVEDFTEDEVLVKTLVEYAKENPDKKLILFAAGEHYVFRIFQNYAVLKDYYIIPYAKPELGIYLSDKANFYAECEKYGLDYPQTEIVSRADFKKYEPTIEFPVVVKPSESADYYSLTFEGKEKAFIIDTKEELSETLDLIYSTDYPHNFLVQEYVTGDVSDEYVMNVYSDQAGKVQMMSLGRIVADDPDPEMRGNYVGITSPGDSEKISQLYEDVKNFLEQIEFTGLSNFDFKFDVQKKEFKAFEVNLRQGRSSYCSIMAGANYAKAIVEDIYEEQSEELLIGDDSFIWTNCSTKGFFEFVEKKDPSWHEELKQITNVGNTLEYKKDQSIKRNYRVKNYLKRYANRINELV